MLNIFKLALLALGVFISAFASADGRGQFGFVYGYSVPDAQNTKPYTLTGAKGLAYITPTFSLGGYYYMSDSKGEPSNAEKFSYSLHGIEPAYHIPSAGGDTYIGIRIGLTKLSETRLGNSSNLVFSPYHYGIVSGYDFFLKPWLMLGFEGSYLHVSPSKTFSGGTLFEERAFNIINFLLTLQVRL